MKKSMRFWQMFLCIYLGVTLMGGVIFMAFPFTSPRWMTGAISLSRPESAIRRDLLRITPIGTSKEEVLSVIEERGWTLMWTRVTAGYFLNRGRVGDGPNPFMVESGESFEIGTQSLRMHLGRFRMILDIDVCAYYAFDEDSKLVDIAIRREMDVI